MAGHWQGNDRGNIKALPLGDYANANVDLEWRAHKKSSKVTDCLTESLSVTWCHVRNGTRCGASMKGTSLYHKKIAHLCFLDRMLG